MAVAGDWTRICICAAIRNRITSTSKAAELQRAVLLTSAQQEERAKGLMEKYPGRFVRSASVNVTRPNAADTLTQAVKDGAVMLGELKDHVAADGPELRRMYDLAGELDVPILVHFQDVPHYAAEGVFATGFKRFEAILKAYPRTKFIGHADEFWANISADYKGDAAYPLGPDQAGRVVGQMAVGLSESVCRFVGEFRK